MELTMKANPLLTLPDKVKPYVMAHRGNRHLCPENTLAAFQQAISDGADILETDLHLTADGELVCIHDATVDRTTDGHGVVAEMTLKELKELNAAHYFGDFLPQRILTLAELMAILPSNIALALELKTDQFLEPEVCLKLISLINSAGLRSRTVVLSFSLPRLRAVRAIAPDIPIGWITLSNPWPIKEPQLLGPFWPLLILNPFYLAIARSQGQLVCPLDPLPDQRLRLYRWLDVDAILTDNSAATVIALRKHSIK